MKPDRINYNKSQEKIEDETIVPKVEDMETSDKNIKGQTSLIETRVVFNCKKLNVRVKPSLQAEVLTILKEGTKVDIIGDSIEGWTQIKSNSGNKGFVMTEYLALE